MSVKILQRRTRLSPTSGISMVKNMDPPVTYNPIPNILGNIDRAFPHRKSVDGAPLSLLDRVKEFIHFKKPNINLANVGDVLQRLKVPGLVLLGVAFVAGLVYLAYKLYRNWSDKKAAETVDKIMADLRETAPSLMEVPGWFEKVRAEVEAAVYSGDETQMVESIAKIKTEIIEKQKSIGEKVGAGIDLFAESPRIHTRIGRGAIMPL